MKIKLYIGAHKTATTHVQNLLDANRAQLLTDNIKLSTPSDLRGEWLPALYEFSRLQDINYQDLTHENYINTIRSECPEEGIWIVAEENVSGISYEFKTHAGIYPNLKNRLRTIRNIFRDDDIEIYFSIRSYESFYRSAYLEVVRNRGYTPFADFFDEDRFKNNSWVNVLDIFCSMVSEENITLWCYEDFREIMPGLLRGLTERDSVDQLIAAYGVETTRPSLSNKTIEVLDSLYPVIGQTESQQMVERINSVYASDGYFMPFTEEELKKFQVKYKEDVSMIRNEYLKINYLGMKDPG